MPKQNDGKLVEKLFWQKLERAVWAIYVLQNAIDLVSTPGFWKNKEFLRPKQALREIERELNSLQRSLGVSAVLASRLKHWLKDFPTTKSKSTSTAARGSRRSPGDARAKAKVR